MGEMWETFLLSNTQLCILLLWYSRECWKKLNHPKGCPLTAFIDLCSITGQSWTRWTERREGRASRLSYLILKSAHLPLDLYSTDSCTLFSSRDLKGLQVHQDKLWASHWVFFSSLEVKNWLNWTIKLNVIFHVCLLTGWATGSAERRERREGLCF